MTTEHGFKNIPFAAYSKREQHYAPHKTYINIPPPTAQITEGHTPRTYSYTHTLKDTNTHKLSNSFNHSSFHTLTLPSAAPCATTSISVEDMNSAWY